ncbi:hypothetical protein SUGI_0129380 [Cryptomeria japonica]|nr:hypothetical protein SUGI_0129380 [Cryptomeria japonica]
MEKLQCDGGRQGVSTKKVERSSEEDNETILFPSIDVSEEVEDDRILMETRAIICKIIGKRRTKVAIKSWNEGNWKMDCIVKFLPKNFFTVVFALEENRNKVLHGGVWMIEDCPLYIQPWSLNFNPFKCSPYDSPIWIRLYNLSIEYWNEECLDKIGRSFGTFMEVDEVISDGDQYVYARMKTAAVMEVPRRIGLIVNGRLWAHEVEVGRINISRFRSKRRDPRKNARPLNRINTRWTPKSIWGRISLN